MRFPTLGLTVLLALPPVVSAQQGHDLFQQALVLERVGGDLTGAMALYQQILRKHPADRPLQARVLAQLGHGYELLGRPEAVETYARLARDFPDQASFAELARARQAGLRTAGYVDATYLMLLAEANDDGSWRATEFDFSPDGASFVTRIRPDERRQTGEFPGNVSALYLGHRDGRLPRLLWSSGDSGIGSPQLPRWSPDGRQIAFLTRPAANQASGERVLLYVVPAGGGSARQIGEAITGRVWDLRWTPDGRLAWSGRRGVQVRTLDGTTSALPGRISARSTLGGFSPDGRWLAIAQPAADSADIQDQEVWLMNVASGALTRVTERSGMDGFPAWGRDGSLFFVSSRAGARNVWRVSIDPASGRAQGNPQQITFYLDADVGHLQAAGAGIGFTLIRTTPTVYVAAAGSERSNPTPTVRGGQPVLSPDGGTVYYIAPGRFKEEYRPAVLAAVSRADGSTRTLASNVIGSFESGLPGYDLSPDGGLIAFMGEAGGKRVLHTVPTSGGPARAMTGITGEWDGAPRFSPDGNQIAFANRTGVYLIGREGGEARRLAQLPGGFEGWSLRWSPDGRQIAIFGYPSASPGGNNAVFLVPADGSTGPRQVSPADQYKEGLDWDPAGGRLTYHLSLRDSRTVQVPATGGPETGFRDEPEVWDYRGRWGPDRRTYYFEGMPDKSPAWQVYRMDTQTGAIGRFAANNASLPSWSRDGRFVTWREAPTASQLWLMENLP